jgi:hypothetical protein
MFVHFLQELSLSPLVVSLVETAYFVVPFILICVPEFVHFVHVVVTRLHSRPVAAR